ncbi:spike base protein, RCAP_Rcc01079 family [Bradyrhizobium elkanii]|uniref:Uncharacterized protein n=1 Tax=Bradyrhizobium elkanii TaxID=29448 RepID=A0A8I1YAY8_BRAEL|nr:hypothetical protein [Bradyrhizobium elkanii]MBP1296620.1 hypothetical protein [Bradyrhizobium elkanii]
MTTTTYDSAEDAIRATAPAKRQRAVTPANADLPDGVANSIEVVTAGNVQLLAEGDTVAITRNAVAAGVIIRVRTKQVQTGTTATVIALY